MKKYLTFLFSIIFLAQSNAQFIDYHNLMNDANESRYRKNYSKSLKLFQEGFAMVDYVHSINYAKAAITAAKVKNYNLVRLYISKAIEIGYPSSIINRKPFRKFRKSKHFEGLQDELEYLEKELDSKFNADYKRKIDSLHFIDQKIIRGNDIGTEFNIDVKVSYSDSSNFKCLLGLIDRYGFPSEQEIGYRGYGKSWILIHHSARLVENHNYHIQLLDYVESGEYLPENYCWVVDQGQELLNEDLIYHHWDVAKNIDGLTEQKMEEIDLKRREVGLASVRRIEVVKKTNKIKW